MMESKEYEAASGFTLAPFQQEVGQAFEQSGNGLVTAPTGSGKTVAVALPYFLKRSGKPPSGKLNVLWITPLRALSRDTLEALTTIGKHTSFRGDIGARTGDTRASQKLKQKKQLPEILVTTPESLHLLLSYPESSKQFDALELVVVDEWHELHETKRGVQVELALSRLKALAPPVKVWGISATIPNTGEALEALIPWRVKKQVIEAKVGKEINLVPIFPDTIERFPWAGHIGLGLLHKVLTAVKTHTSVLIFTNTRSHTERWFQALLEADPDLAGQIAIHHGSLDPKERAWVEQALHDGALRVVVCTSSLDLGVDFSPVDAVVQIGSPKDAARIIQRAGRSGHSPGLTSTLYFVPTHSLEIIEFEALKRAVDRRIMGGRTPVLKPLDVLCQYMVTLACGDGFNPEELLNEVRQTKAYRTLSNEMWSWALDFLISGGRSLRAYDEYRKVVSKEGRIHIESADKAKRHRMAIGTIVADLSVTVKFQRGKTIGTVEESFISKLRPGDVFLLGGRTLEYLRLKEYVLLVKNANRNKVAIPRWMGGRLSLSSEYAEVLREVIDELKKKPTLISSGLLVPLLEIQSHWSRVPISKELLIEQCQSRDGYHLFIFPFEGRAVHEGLGMIVAERLSRIEPLTFSIAANDYGIELLSDQPIPFTSENAKIILSPFNIEEDCIAAMNASEIARRKFKEIARISGLTFAGYPSKRKSEKYVMASAQLVFDVFEKYDPGNLLVAQAYEEALTLQLQSERIKKLLMRVKEKRIVITSPSRFTPFAFPLVVDRLREKITSERLEQRLKRMIEENNRELKKTGINVPSAA